MDFDSSSKFISSLAKFLQSLCNGYVEFDSGVEVIGHIYISVDTGKKIDYILNEKVCKTDENSVTFISNSFHAQPAEKPKPQVKNDKEQKKSDDDDIIIMDTPASTNTGTIPTREDNQQNAVAHSKTNRPTGVKRPHGPNSSNRNFAKQMRTDPSNPNGVHQNSNDSDSSLTFLQSGVQNESALSAPTESDISHLSQVFPQSLPDTSNAQEMSEERDVKPNLESDLKFVNVKQEYDSSLQVQGEEEQDNSQYETQDESSYYSGMQSHEASYDMGNSQYYSGRRGHTQRSDYGQMDGMGQADMYSQGAAGSMGDPNAMGEQQQSQELQERNDTLYSGLLSQGYQCPVPTCGQKKMSFERAFRRHWKEKHEKMVMSFQCGLCSYRSKRKDNLAKHIRRVHKSDPEVSQGTVFYEVNQDFVDPHPFNYESAVSQSWTSLPPIP